ncbi:hypothetical protein C7999DRAFT_35631 [Corynascus novoguineensis]|uniref:Uncharacterized protein n=1 Tax=Corynascus novoguineensis TaxID=1126955 RepID=A0AAN7HJ65_9PEZI|nr:hypothetical protein C7999DRAFT_35631 [Corynascus novoguineensis]
MAKMNLLTLAVVASSVGGALAGCSSNKCRGAKADLSCSAAAQSGLTFGGLVVSTQFWDTYTGLESKGQLLPKDSFTLHGLWPDFCNGSWTQYLGLGCNTTISM